MSVSIGMTVDCETTLSTLASLLHGGDGKWGYRESGYSDITATEISMVSGIPENEVRRHVESLANHGLVELSSRHPAGVETPFVTPSRFGWIAFDTGRQ